MKETKNLKLKIPEKNEYINIADINENAEKIDEELAKKADASGGDISETVITTVEASQDEYPVPAAGDSAKTVLGKVQKFFADIRNWMKGVCLLGQIVNNCVTDNAKLPLSAAQGKVLMDLYNVLNTNQKNTSDKLAALNSVYFQSGTVFAMIQAFEQLPGCFMKYGSENISDSPLENQQAEFGGLILGHDTRKVILLVDYVSCECYVRSIFQNQWATNAWRKLS